MAERICCCRGVWIRLGLPYLTDELSTTPCAFLSLSLSLSLCSAYLCYQYSLRHTAHASELVEKVDTLVPKIDPSKKVLRYRPGQAPSW